MKQTAVQQLKEKLQTVVDELKDAQSGTDQYGYRSAMENVIKDIDAQMLRLEKQQIVEAFEDGQANCMTCTRIVDYVSGNDYYTQTYTQSHIKEGESD